MWGLSLYGLNGVFDIVCSSDPNNFKVCLGYRCHCSVNYDLSYFKKEIGIKPADRHPGMVIKSWQDDFFSACM